MPEMEYIKYRDFVESLSRTESPTSSDKVVVSNPTNGPRSMPGSAKDRSTAITAFRAGDVIPVDGPNGPAKMSKDDLLRLTSQHALESVDDVENTAGSADLDNSNYFVITGAGGVKKLPTELLESASTISISKNHADNANISLNEYWKNNNGTIQLASATNFKAVPRIFLRAGRKYTMSIAPNALCWIGNSVNRYIGQVSSIADGNVITPLIDCYVYISFSTEIDYNYFMLVDGEVLPDDFHPYNEIFSVKINDCELLSIKDFEWKKFVNDLTAITSFVSTDAIAVSNPTDGPRKMSKDALLQLTSQHALESVDDVENTAGSADLANSNYFVITGAGGVKKLPTELLESASTISISKNHADNANISLNEYWKNNNGTIQLASATNFKAVPRIFLRAGRKYTMSIAPNALCWIGNSVNRYIGQVSSIADGNVITPLIDCYVYISFSTEIDYNYFMLVDGEVLPDDFHPYNEIFSVKIKGVELVQKEYGENKIFYVKQSGGDFATLKEGIEAATQYNNSILYVEKNTYDLVSEFGQSYLDSTSSDKGLILKNGIHVIFEPGSKVVFNYSGSNAFIHSQFSPFNSGIHGFTLENVIIEASNCRYCVHDERGNSSDRYVNKYFNCDMSLDNSQNPDWSSPQPIGCGLCWGFVYISNCRFNNWISFHTNAGSSTSSKAKAVVSGCYFSEGGVMVGSTGVSTEYTDIYVNNNFGYVRNLDVSSPPSVVNLRLYEWNNVH